MLCLILRSIIRLDFFDHAIHLTIDQKKRFMQHLLKLNMEKENLSFKLVYETSGTNFDNDFTQCLFLSDSIAYARLDTKNGNNNLVIFHQSDMKQLLHNFFEHFWNDSSLTDDRENVQNYIKEILQPGQYYPRFEEQLVNTKFIQPKYTIISHL